MCAGSGRDGVCAGRLVARGAQPGRHHRHNAELLQRRQLPHRVAQDGARPPQTVKEVVQSPQGELAE